MKTNTVEQAIRLKELGVNNIGAWAEDCKFPYTKDVVRLFEECEESGGSNRKNIYKGPALTLDELHRFFKGIGYWPILSKDQTYWFLRQNKAVSRCGKRQPSTSNDAEDWTAILIWLLENKHVMVEQVNSILGE